MSKLYEITGEIQSLQSAYEAGEIPEEAFLDTLQGVQMELSDKVENICKLRTNLLSDVAGYDAEIKRLQEHKAATKNHVDNLQNYLQAQLKAAGQQKIKAGTFTASIAKSPAAVHITDESLIPADYFTTPQPVINKTAIKDAIKAGTVVAGAELVQGEHINIK